MAKSNQRSGWRKSKTRAVVPTTTEFGSRGRETRKLLFRVSMLTTLAIMLFGILILVLYSTPDRDVPLILSVVSKSEARLSEDSLYTPPNFCAAEDVELLRAWFGGGDDDPSENVRLAGRARDGSGMMNYEANLLIDALTKPLLNARPGGPEGNMIAMYLSAHGFVDRGTAYLAVGDSRPDRKETWIRFDKLFEAITETLNERDDAAKGVKLVFFIDSARVGPQWDWGQFYESFVLKAEDIVNGESDRIAVIFSAQPGQRSWWDPREGHGLFTKAVVESLTGKGDRDRDGSVTVGEIVDYLAENVQQMASETWNASQVPMLAGESDGQKSPAREWNFISQPNPVTPPAVARADVEQLRADFAAVDALWDRHNKLETQIHPPLGFNPLAWATLEKKLARLDMLLLAGKGYRSNYESMLGHCRGDLTQFEMGPDALAKEEALPELALRDYFLGKDHELKSLSEQQRLLFDEMVTTWRTKKPDIAAAIQLPLTEARAIRFLLEWLNDKNYEPEAMRLAAELLQKAKLVTASSPPRLLESQFVRMLTSRDLSHVSQETVKLIAETHTASRDAICTNDLRALFWIRDRVDVLEKQRLYCIDRMLSKNPDEQATGRSRWKEVRKSYASLIELGNGISKAYKLRDTMLHEIPRIVETLMHDPEAFAKYEQLPGSRSGDVMKRSVESLTQLTASLKLRRDDDSRDPDALRKRILVSSSTARAAFEELEKRITVRLNDATTEKAGDAEGLRQNFALLVGTGTSRAVLRKRVHDRLADLIGDESAAIGILKNQTGNGAGTDEDSELARMTVDQRHVWDFWLSSVAPDAVGSTPDQNGENAESNADAASLEKRFLDTGASFRDLLSTLAEGQLDSQTTADDVLRDPISKSEEKAKLPTIRRDVESWDTFLRSRTILFTYAPSKVENIGKGRFALDQQLFLFEHASRTINEFWCEAKEGDEPFFVSAAGSLLSSRIQNPLFPNIATSLDGVSLSDTLGKATDAAKASVTLQPQPGEKFREGTLLKFVLGKNVEFVMKRPAVVPDGLGSLHCNLDDQTESKDLDDEKDGWLRVPMRVPEKLPADEAAIEAELFFRGLRRRGRIAFKTPTNGRRTVFTLPNYGAPMARVARQVKEPERLLLVFDCSLSMKAPTANGQSRLEVAQNAVSGFLNGLDPNVEVGLIVFGDRYGFEEKPDPNNGGKASIFPEVVDGIKKLRVVRLINKQVKPAGLIVPDANVPNNPNFDVRVSVPINPLDNRQRGVLTKEIGSLGAIGTTPTYLAIRKAYEQLARRKGHIIVLTDGKPKVITTPNVPVNDSRNGAIQDYQNNKNDVQLTIVKYLAGGASQLDKDFAGADFLKAATGRELLKHLQDVRSKPEVVWERNREEVSNREDFEALVTVSEWPPKGVGTPAGQPVLPAEPFSIRAMIPDSANPIDERAPVRVEGGEQFDLLLVDRELVHRPFQYEFTQLQSISTASSDAARFKVTAGPISKRENRQLTIQVAVESASGGTSSGKFTPRPTDIWVELTGIDSRRFSRGNKEVYSFSMPEFQSRQPIPILLCRIDDFSEQFDKVEVKAWMVFGKQRLKGAEIPTDSKDGYRDEKLPGVTFRTERKVTSTGGIRVTVTEQYGAEREPGTLRVLPTPLPNQASTVLYAKDRVVTRTFDFDDAESAISLSAIESAEIKRRSSLSASGTVQIDFDSR